MALQWEQVIVHASDPATLGQWWAEALDWVVVQGDQPWNVLADPEGHEFCILGF